jgi:hypothetical protein
MGERHLYCNARRSKILPCFHVGGLTFLPGFLTDLGSIDGESGDPVNGRGTEMEVSRLCDIPISFGPPRQVDQVFGDRKKRLRVIIRSRKNVRTRRTFDAGDSRRSR